ncbi:MAG: acyltransferase domain-containing protein, partial [Desulfuromonadales bacterium]
MIAFLFPGQGSQHAGMGKDLAENFPLARQVFEEANDALGIDLAALCFKGPEEDLKLTANTQPAILTTSVAALRVLQNETGIVPHYAAGHSLGEYSALVCAGALDFADAVRIVRQRGTFMQEAVPVGTGAMAAILGLDTETLDRVCRAAAQD